MINLNTTEDVIDVLGGLAELSTLTGTSVNGVYNWRTENKFPADTYLLIQGELKLRNLIAPDHLWPMRKAVPVGKRKTRAGT
jgi:hypothetical protein